MDTEIALFWGFIALIALVVGVVIALLVHAGLFSPVDVKTCKPEIGEIQIAYKFARGPYRESGMLFTEVHTLLPEYRTLGVYYDDPRTKQPHKLRYIVGVILSENGSPIVPGHRKLLEEKGYHFATFPSIDHAVQTIFPYTSTISIIVAIMKVYPALSDYIEARSLCAHPFLEVYESEKSRIIFIGPLARQDDFCVPEVRPEEEDDHQDEYEDDDRTENSSRSWDESASFVRGMHPLAGRVSRSDGLNSPEETFVCEPRHTRGELNDSECSEGVGDDCSSYPHPPSEAPSESSTHPLLPVPSQPDDAVETAAQTAHITVNTANTSEAADIADPIDTGSVGGEESDANTGSSFEEIDEKEAASIPCAGASSKNKEATLKKDEDEGER
ncbi:uncharacterized protein [Panulirus ornatus]|uniref:uncharacterized protein isoform X1 n=1 Tax=Panulirus ornatus TaxID=150431 RepID=UPI003A8B682D